MRASPMTFETSIQAVEESWEAVSTDLVFLRRVDSTNRLARQVARELERDEVAIRATLFLAWEQTMGRGRHGRSWESPPGLGIYATLLLPLVDRPWARALPLAAAVSLCESVSGWCAAPCRVKWPNDLLVGDRKIGGILIESGVSGTGTGYASVGFGVNHGHREEELPMEHATSLRREAPTLPGYAPAVAELTRHLTAAVRSVSAPQDVIERFRELSVHEPGETLTCRVGEETVEGRFARFTDDGFLVLQTAAGERTLSAGDLA